MIIIEGPDGTGKTTLAKMLHMTFQIPRMHSFKELPKDSFIAEERFLWNKAMLGLRLIMDRCYVISEWIHGPILRDKSLITDDQLARFIQQMNHTSRVVYLFCDGFYGHISDGENPDRVVKAEQNWDKIAERYRELYKRIKCERWYIKSIDDYAEVLWMIRRVYER